MSYRCRGSLQGCNSQHAWGVYTGRHVRWYSTHETGRVNGRADDKAWTKSISEIRDKRKKENGPLCGVEKSLYGTLQAAFLFWRHFTSSLQEWGFEINTYDWCVASNTVNGNQITVVFHVYNLKISYDNGDTVDTLIRKLSKWYGKEADLTFHRGKAHQYLGMKLDYREQGNVKIYMTDYL